MPLNCKPGDLAVIVRTNSAKANYIGRVIRVTTLSTHHFQAGPAWNFEGAPLQSLDGSKAIEVANDCCLRPLRDSHGQDEVLKLIGLPVVQPQTA